jgi:hypothetical protein
MRHHARRDHKSEDGDVREEEAEPGGKTTGTPHAGGEGTLRNMEVRVRGSREGDPDMHVCLANVPSDGQGEWFIREMMGCFPERHLLTDDGFQVAAKRILAWRKQAKEGGVIEVPLVAADCGQGEAYEPIRVRMACGARDEVTVANLPRTHSGIVLLHRLRSEPKYAGCDFLTDDLGWFPLSGIDPRSLPPKPDAKPKRDTAVDAAEPFRGRDIVEDAGWSSGPPSPEEQETDRKRIKDALAKARAMSKARPRRDWLKPKTSASRPLKASTRRPKKTTEPAD